MQWLDLRCRDWIFIFLERERESSFSLDFWPFGSSILDGARSKVVLRGEGYVWTRFGGVLTTPRGRDLFLLVIFFG